jgi:hypothetical protein
MELLRALQFASYRHSKVAHDHIYGLRSLLTANDQASLQPDYNLSVCELYASTTKLLLQKGNSVSLLCAAVGTSQQNEHKLPSWSFDFSKPLKLPVHQAGLKKCEDLSKDLASDFNVLYLRGKYLGEQISAYASRGRTFDGATRIPEIRIFLTRVIYEEEGDRHPDPMTVFDQRLADSAHDAKRTTESRSYWDQRYVYFSTHQGSFGKSSNEVQKGDEI